jgi:hypothetical protein
VGTNRLYAKQGRAATNALGEKAKKLFLNDSIISDYYNRVMAGGKWNHMMDQTHIGYTYWQQPDKNLMPETRTIELPRVAEMGVCIEGTDHWWPAEKSEPVLPEFTPFGVQTHSIDVFNRGEASFTFSVNADQPWMKVVPSNGIIHTEQRLWVSVDWKEVPAGKHEASISIAGPSKSQIVVHAVINSPAPAERAQIDGFVESNGCVSIEAEHFSHAKGTSSITWTRIPGLGRTLSALTPNPDTAASQTPGGENPRLEYQMYLFTKGEVEVKTYLSPTLNYYNNDGLRYAISFDDEQPQIMNMHAKKTFQDWEQSVRTNVTILASKHLVTEAGKHILKFWMVDPGVVLQKLVVETGASKSSYLGPPESTRVAKTR